MIVHIYSAKCSGIDAVKVTVEINITRGIGIHLVGLADVAVKESLLRTTTALQSLGFHIPGQKIVVNLAPADMHKSGSGYDLPIALGIIAASGQRQLTGLEKYLVMGELGLDGTLRDIPGALPYAELAAKEYFKGIILPAGSALEAVEFKQLNVFAAANLNDVIDILEEQSDCRDLLVWNTEQYTHTLRHRNAGDNGRAEVDLADIIGQEGAKRALEIAASGSHNLLFLGSPGSGKSSLAKALPGILPPMTDEEAIVTNKIYSIVGKGNPKGGLSRTRPFRSPHYSASCAAIIGGGAGDSIMPGEVTLAHNGVLFADEFGQMPKSVIESLRGPMEDRKVTISRLRSKVEYPASFMLVAASNPCPCGYWGEGDRCTCTPVQRMNYISKLSGPILDRIDLQCVCHSVSTEDIVKARQGGRKPESSAQVAERVLKARKIQEKRFAKDGISCNAEMTNRQIEKYCRLSDSSQETLTRVIERMQLSMRAYFRILKVARTIADIEGADDLKPEHILEAAGYRFLDRGRELD